MEPETQTKRCRACSKQKAINDFRRRCREGGARVNVCRACRNQADRLRRQAQRSRRDRKRADSFSTRLRGLQDASRAVALANSMVVSFGGIDSLVAAWSEHAMLAMEESPGSQRVLGFFLGVVTLKALAEQHSLDVEDFDDVEDDDVEQELKRSMRELLVGEPALVLQAAAALGWTVIQPDAG